VFFLSESLRPAAKEAALDHVAELRFSMMMRLGSGGYVTARIWLFCTNRKKV